MTNDGDNRLIAVVIVTAILLLLGGKLLFAKLVYDDWSCAIAECRKAK